MSIKTKTYHLHLESGRKRPIIFQLHEADWLAAAKRHRALAKKLRVTIGHDNEILDDALKTADFMINAAPPKDGLRTRAPSLKWIQTTSAGVDGLMPMTWLPQDITLTNNTGAHGAKAEESCLMALLMLQSRMPEVIRQQHEQVWKGIFTTPISGKTVVIVGFGDLGRGAGRAAKKLGLHVIAVTRSGNAAKPADRVVKSTRIDSVLPKADFVIVTTPLTAETRGLIHRERINLLKPGAGFVNIGRSPIVDYVALREKLESGELCGAVLDVFDQEPLPPDSPFWTTKNLVVLPHISCDDPRYIAHLLDFWFSNFERFLAGKKLKNIVDRQLGY
ncbi:MAG: D-2-hydroxyacid dehydrogenase [Burkholderiales bacterium]